MVMVRVRRWPVGFWVNPNHHAAARTSFVRGVG